MEWVLGLTVRSDRLHFSPSIAGSWPGYQILYRHGKTSYEITVENPQSIERGQVLIKLDGKHQNGEDGILLHDDGLTHKVVVILKPEIQ
jgi:cyclic beta-1,2-glucan synthetase